MWTLRMHSASIAHFVGKHMLNNDLLIHLIAFKVLSEIFAYFGLRLTEVSLDILWSNEH